MTSLTIEVRAGVRAQLAWGAHGRDWMSATTLPTPEQSQRAKWDLLLLDIETRTEQLRQLKTFEPRRLMIQGPPPAASRWA